MGTLTIDRSTRDALRDRISFDAGDMEGLEGALQTEKRSRAVRLRDRASLWIELLDDLGWEDHGSSDDYAITADLGQLAEWLHDVKRQVDNSTTYNLDTLVRQRPLPAGLSPHKCRHTFASLLVALGNDPAHVMGQLGHTDPAFTLRVYTHMMRRDPGEREQLRALVDGADWAAIGQPTELLTVARLAAGLG